MLIFSKGWRAQRREERELNQLSLVAEKAAKEAVLFNMRRINSREVKLFAASRCMWLSNLGAMYRAKI